jgi:hypothetical protein
MTKKIIPRSNFVIERLNERVGLYGNIDAMIDINNHCSTEIQEKISTFLKKCKSYHAPETLISQPQPQPQPQPIPYEKPNRAELIGDFPGSF